MFIHDKILMFLSSENYKKNNLLNSIKAFLHVASFTT